MTGRYNFRASVHPAGHGSVHVGDEDISNAVKGFTLDAEVGNRPQVELRLAVWEVSEVDAEDVQLHIPQETALLLKRLGWTPPEES